MHCTIKQVVGSVGRAIPSKLPSTHIQASLSVDMIKIMHGEPRQGLDQDVDVGGLSGNFG